MCLHYAVFVQGSPVADFNEVELEEAGCVYVDAAADTSAEQPEIPGEKRGAPQRLERERRSEKLVERVHELQPPDKVAPKRTLEGAEVSHDDPLAPLRRARRRSRPRRRAVAAGAWDRTRIV